MRHTIIKRSFYAIAFIGGLLTLCVGATGAMAAGQAPDPAVCNNTATPPVDPIVQGGCIAITRAKGNCQACHQIAGIPSGNIAPPLVSMTARFPDRAPLRNQIENPALLNAKTVMPPYGKHKILTQEEIDKVVDWVLTL